MTEQSQTAQSTAKTTGKRWATRLSIWLVKGILGLCFPLFLLMFAIDFATGYWVRDQIYTDIKQLPYRKYAVVLGTAKFYQSGSPNLYYKYRLEAAQKVFTQQKVDYLLVSGDNKTAYYNEPKMMTNDLQKMGIPSARIQQDYAGYSTLDSIIRADKVFHLKPFLIISQQFHCERALFIAKFRNIDAICFAAKYPDYHYKVRIREFFARTSMIVSLLIGQEATTLEPSKQIK